jgi:hypothetical protein
MSGSSHVSWRWTRVAVLAVIVAGTLIACDEASVPFGPGPDGPVGPTGPSGREERTRGDSFAEEQRRGWKT